MDTQTKSFSEVADCRLTYQRGGKGETISLVHGTTTFLQTLDIPALITRGGTNVYLCATIAESLYNEIPNSHPMHIQTARNFIQEEKPEQLVELVTRLTEETWHEEG